jgi:large subunit ribosomal protein L18
MARKKYISIYRRRREGKTDYKKRISLISSGLPRLVIRKSLKHITLQIISYNPDGDKVLLSANTKELIKIGWKAPCGNISSSYLTGLLLGIKAKKNNFSSAIVDIGLNTSTKGSRIYAAVKGVIDGGLNVSCSEKIFPDENKLQGKTIANYALILKKENKDFYEKYFSLYLKMNILPEDVPKHFNEIKNKILKG